MHFITVLLHCVCRELSLNANIRAANCVTFLSQTDFLVDFLCCFGTEDAQTHHWNLHCVGIDIESQFILELIF